MLLRHLFLFSFFCLFSFTCLCLRVISVDLVADQWILWLLKPEVIKGVTYLAQDPKISFLHKAAEAYPSHHNTLEDMMALKPDVVVSDAPLSAARRAFFKKRGIAVFVLPSLFNTGDFLKRYQAMRHYFKENMLPGVKIEEQLYETLETLPYLFLEPHGHVGSSHIFLHRLFESWGLKRVMPSHKKAYMTKEELALLPSTLLFVTETSTFPLKNSRHKVCKISLAYVLCPLPQNISHLHAMLKRCING